LLLALSKTTARSDINRGFDALCPRCLLPLMGQAHDRKKWRRECPPITWPPPSNLSTNFLRIVANDSERKHRFLTKSFGNPKAAAKPPILNFLTIADLRCDLVFVALYFGEIDSFDAYQTSLRFSPRRMQISLGVEVSHTRSQFVRSNLCDFT
jgi:hypothetical protein